MPFYIDVSKKRILIIGGGNEAAKRSTKYAQAGAKVTVLALNFNAALQQSAARGIIRTIQSDVSNTRLVERLVSESDLVMVTLDTKEHNQTLVAIGQKTRRLVNLTNDAAATEVVVPVEEEVRGIRLAATSEGKSVHVTREALQRAARFLEEQRDLWVLFELMQELRETLRARDVPLDSRMRIYSAVYRDRRVREEAEKQNAPAAREAMYAAIDRLLRENLPDRGNEA